MAIEAGDIIKVAARLAWDGLSDIMNSWHVRVHDTLTNTQSEIIEDIRRFISAVYSEWSNSVPENTEFVDLNLVNVTKGESYGSYDWVGLTNGGGVGDPYAPGVAVFCWLPTLEPKSFGRKWIGPFQESNFDAGTVIGGVITIISNGLDLLMSQYEASGGFGTLMDYVVEHATENGNPVVPPEYNPPWGYNIASQVGYQRRRRPGVGS